jgi:hypothetical protein
MDFGLLGGLEPGGAAAPESGVPPFDVYEPARYAMGDTRRFAERMHLLDVEPRGDLSSTGYALAKPGREYLVLQPGEATQRFSVTLEPGSYTAEWFSVGPRATQGAEDVTVRTAGTVQFSAPYADPGPAVLYLKRV